VAEVGEQADKPEQDHEMSRAQVSLGVRHYGMFVGGGNAVCTSWRQEDTHMPSRTDELISRGMAKAKVMKGALTGLGGVFRTLMEQHGKVSGLLHRIKSAEVEKRGELWNTVRPLLLAHERAESEVIYRELHYDPRTRALAERHDQEASELEQLTRELDSLPVTDPQWKPVFERLFERIEHHVFEEEGDTFRRAQDVFGKQRAKALDATLQDAFAAQLGMA
jgi:hypothetical protein